MVRRGQAALEFLSTYGFAFMIILVMIGALTYFGVLSPNKLIPNRCDFPPNVNCFDFQVQRNTNTQATLSLILVNQLGNSIDFNSTAGGYNVTGETITSSACVFPASSVVGGGRATITCTLTATAWAAVGEKVKLETDFQTRELGRTYWQPIRGEVLATLS